MGKPMRIDYGDRLEAATVGGESLPRMLQLERALARLAARQEGVAARWQLLELGFTPRQIQHRIDSGRLIPLYRGAYAVGHDAIKRDGRLHAATLAADAPLSCRDAGAHLGMPDFTFGNEIEVTVRGTGSRRIQGLRIHRSRDLEPWQVIMHRGIPVTTAARTLFDLAGRIGPTHFRRCFDVADRRGIVDYEEVAYLIKNSRGHRGIGRFARAAGLGRSQSRRTRSILELDFLAFCREEQIPQPLVNHIVDGFEVDAVWPDAKLVVELDSWEHHGDREAFERDRIKLTMLQQAGFMAIPLTSRRLRRERTAIATAILARLAEPITT